MHLIKSYTIFITVSSERCDQPEDIANGTIAYINDDSSSIMVGDVITYSCVPGMHLIGSRERFCLRTGNWTGSQPMCHGMCTYVVVKHLLQCHPFKQKL